MNGKRYLNEFNCWKDLGSASRDARYLGLVPIEAFVDQRTDEAVIHLSNYKRDAELGIEDRSFAYLPTAFGERLLFSSVPYGRVHNLSIYHSLPDHPEYTFTPPMVGQRYHIEIWCEKTTVADVLLPLAQEYRLNVVMGAGDISLTHCHQFVERVKQSGKPARLLYVTDFDPQGHKMPPAVARKTEFLIYRENLHLDVQVRPVALTYEQCIHYRLPRIPIKESAKGRERFEERFGEGATELDALEALHPGSLRQILIQEIRRYHD
jgi:hypothetical protein